LIFCLCLGVKSRALVLNAMAENLDALKWWWLGVFIAPTTKPTIGVGLLSMGAPDSPVRHRTLFFLNPNLFFLLVCVEPMTPVEHII
jgi:hypothetical protein